MADFLVAKSLEDRLGTFRDGLAGLKRPKQNASTTDGDRSRRDAGVGIGVGLVGGHALPLTPCRVAAQPAGRRTDRGERRRVSK